MEKVYTALCWSCKPKGSAKRHMPFTGQRRKRCAGSLHSGLLRYLRKKEIGETQKNNETEIGYVHIIIFVLCIYCLFPSVSSLSLISIIFLKQNGENSIVGQQPGNRDSLGQDCGQEPETAQDQFSPLNPKPETLNPKDIAKTDLGAAAAQTNPRQYPWAIAKGNEHSFMLLAEHTTCLLELYASQISWRPMPLCSTLLHQSLLSLFLSRFFFPIILRR